MNGGINVGLKSLQIGGSSIMSNYTHGSAEMTFDASAVRGIL
jgi:hypothetical protein